MDYLFPCAHVWLCTEFISYAVLVAITATVLIFYVSPRIGRTNPLVYITITGTMGSLTVMACKGLGVAIKQTVAGDSQLANPVTWLIGTTVVFCIVVQVLGNHKQSVACWC